MEPTTAEQRADRWEQMAERNIAPIVAQLADLYKRLEIAGDQHRELAEQLGDLKAELEKARELLKDTSIHDCLKNKPCDIADRIEAFLEGSK